MHNAPAVTYPVGRCRIQRIMMFTGWLSGGLVLAYWVMIAPDALLAQLACGGVWLLAGVWAWCAYLSTPEGHWAWDGQQWTWLSLAGEQMGQAHLQLDGQKWVLLAWQPLQARRQWCWADCSADPARWQDFRRALCASAQTGPTQPGAKAGMTRASTGSRA